jgi:hypothetical protein
MGKCGAELAAPVCNRRATQAWVVAHIVLAKAEWANMAAEDRWATTTSCVPPKQKAKRYEVDDIHFAML